MGTNKKGGFYRLVAQFRSSREVEGDGDRARMRGGWWVDGSASWQKMASVKARKGAKKKKQAQAKASQVFLAIAQSKPAANNAKYLDLSLPLPPDVNALIQGGLPEGEEERSSSASTPDATGSPPKMRPPKKKAEGGGKKGTPAPARKKQANAAPRKPTASKNESSILSDKQLARNALRREREAKQAQKAAAAAAAHAPAPSFESLDMAPVSPRKGLRRADPSAAFSAKDAQTAILLGFAGIKPQPRSFAQLLESHRFLANESSQHSRVAVAL